MNDESMNDGYIELAAAIVKKTVDDYVCAALSLSDSAQDHARALEKWFTSGYAQTLSMGHGSYVLKEAKNSVIESAVRKYAGAKFGAYVVGKKLETAKTEKVAEKLKSALTRHKSNIAYMDKWFRSPWANSICNGKALEYLKQARMSARERISEYNTAHNLC